MTTTNKTISANGCVALWELSGVFAHDDIALAFRVAGLDTVKPARRTPAAALHATLTEVYGRRGVLVRPCGTDGFVVVEDVPDAAGLRLDRRDLQGVRVDDSGELVIREADNAEVIREVYARAVGQIDVAAVSTALTSAVGLLSGTAIRSRGGVYWVPASGVSRWRALGTALSALETGSATCYAVTTVGDESTVQAIADAFVREVDAEVRAVEAALAEGSLGKRASAARASDLADLALRAEQYEAVLGCALAELRARIDKVGCEAGRNALMA